MTNSQVPFIQVTTYKTYDQLAALASQYPNAIIFYKAENPSTNLTEASIWAHGLEYKTGGGNTRVRIGSVDIDPTDATVGFGSAPALGDFYIKETAIANTNPVQYSRTAYVYALNSSNELVWQVLDGNVNAENVYFPTGFERTEKWGVKQSENSVPTVDQGTVGKNLKDVFEYYLVKEKWPDPTPSTSDGSQVTTDTFAVVDGGATLSLKLNTSGGNNIDTYVLYGNDVYASGEYITTLTKTASPGIITYNDSRITGMSFGYGTSASSGRTSSDQAKPATLQTFSRTVTDNQNVTSGKATSKMYYDNPEGTDDPVESAENNASGGADIKLSTTHTISEPAIGTHTVSLINTNAASWGRSFSPNTNVTTSNISAVYYCTNKGNTDGSHYKSVTGKTINLPASSVSCSNPSGAEKSFTVYYPVYGNMKNASGTVQRATNTTMYEFDKITGNSKEITWSTSNGWANTDGTYKLKYPSIYTATPSLNGTTLTKDVHYTLSSPAEETLGKNKKVNYTTLTITDAKYSNVVNFKITLSKS